MNSNTNTNSLHWLFSKKTDLIFLNGIVWCCWLFFCFVPQSILKQEIPLWAWVVFILGMDVGHVWSTLFRTYLDKEEFKNHRKSLLLTPVLAIVTVFGIVLYSELLFWRLLAYYAVFHFIKQQYGFMALYRMKAKHKYKQVIKDKWVIYWATLYPVLYWHLSGDRAFNWFAENDFIALNSLIYFTQNSIDSFLYTTNILYWIILIFWFFQELYLSKKHSIKLSWGKSFCLFTTAGNWYLGIIYFNSDIVFSVTNVVAHGVPYLVLIYYYQAKKQNQRSLLNSKTILKTKGWKYLSVLVTGILVLAFIEEYCWDMWVYQERTVFFQSIINYPFSAAENSVSYALAIGFLTMPQLTHYILDGIIWKSNHKNPYLKTLFSNKK